MKVNRSIVCKKKLARILSIAWHKDEEMIVTGGIDNIRIWDVNSGQVMQRISLGRLDKNKETLVWCLAITALVLKIILFLDPNLNSHLKTV